MRRYKTVARVFLVLSVIDFTFAGLPHTRAAHEVRADLVTVVADVVMEASDKRSSMAAGQAHSRRDPGGLSIPEQVPQPALPAEPPPLVAQPPPLTQPIGPAEPPPLVQPIDPAQPAHPAEPASKPAAASEKELEAAKFFNKELTRKMKEYLVLGFVAGAFTGVTNAIQKQIMGTVSPGAYVFYFTSFFSLLSCQLFIFNGPRHVNVLTDDTSQSNCWSLPRSLA